ncbi:hypothetical protein G6011_02098 [Alternaria panax]|uniref:Uncharacterized protein n=1 Tax=Alternaria panax TaxID=48097 RepID=A0AAD4I490_9PLEO|nr:hypothetical protein G6011_02098 [Alternaria panax]
MESNIICGEVLRKATAQHYLELTQSLHNLITYTLDHDSEHGLASQKQDTWSLRSARRPDPLDESISNIKSKIHSCHVGFYEDWKDIKYGTEIKWPKPEHAGSLWKVFARAMDQDRPIYEMRNWFSHDFGKRGGTLDVENERFNGLQEAYESLLPSLTELLAKLELAIQDEAAWKPESTVKAQKCEQNQPEYTKDTMVVQLELAARQEKLIAMTKQVEIDHAVRLARLEEGLDLWVDEEWVMKEDVGGEWVGALEEGAVPWTNLGEVDESLWDYASNVDDDTLERTEDLPATLAHHPDDRAYDSGYEEGDEVQGSLCKASLFDARYINATILPHGDEMTFIATRLGPVAAQSFRPPHST